MAALSMLLLRRRPRRVATEKAVRLMGETHAEVTVRKDARSKHGARVRCVVDTGTDLTVLPRAFLARLGVQPNRREAFGLADGRIIEHDIGRAFFQFAARGEYSPVVFGEQGDATLLGVLTLENLGLGVDPLRREWFPLELKM